MSEPFHVVIPARYASSRLPGKLLMNLGGQTILERVYRQALQATPKSIIIATDHQGIFEQATRWGANVVMTDPQHESGTHRIAEVAKLLKFSAEEIIVNVQGDEPFISPLLIRQVAQALADADTPMATLCWPLHALEEYTNPNIVKVVRNCKLNALYFSRSPIPAYRDVPVVLPDVFRHIGLYAYRTKFLLDSVHWPVCALERVEALEQLRILWMGHAIRVEEACVAPGQDINTAVDLQRAQDQLDQ